MRARLARDLRTLGASPPHPAPAPVPAPVPALQPGLGPTSSSSSSSSYRQPLGQGQGQGQGEALMMARLSSRLPALSDKDLLRAVYLLGARRFPLPLLRSGGLLAVIDSRVANMLPELEAVALVALLGSMQRLGLARGDLPLALGGLVSHSCALAATLDRRTLIAALRGLGQAGLGLSWDGLNTQQQQGLAAGVARAATAKPSSVSSLFSELEDFGASWSQLEAANLTIVLRYVVFRLFSNLEQARAAALEADCFLGLASASSSSSFSSAAEVEVVAGAGAGGGEGEAQAVDAAGEALVSMMNLGCSWDALGHKAAHKVLRSLAPYSAAGVLTKEQRLALELLASQAPPESLGESHLQQQ